MSEHVHPVPDAPQATHSAAAAPSGMESHARLSEAEIAEARRVMKDGRYDVIVGVRAMILRMADEIEALHRERDAARALLTAILNKTDEAPTWVEFNETHCYWCSGNAVFHDSGCPWIMAQVAAQAWMEERPR